MTPIQQMFLGVGGATKTYIDDVFSTYLYAGDGDNNRVITTNIDQSGEGCLTWIKSRTAGESHILVDTVRGASKIIYSDGSGAEQSNTDIVPAFTSAGFKPGSHSSVNGSGNNFAGWTFRNAPGFFDVVTWSGNATAGRQIPHNLGCVPGAIFTKRLNVSENWLCYHKGVGNEKYLHLNTDSVPGDAQYWYDTDPTSTYFTVNDAQQINGAGYNYVAYLFAGGGSTAATARSVDFDGTGDDLRWASNTDFAMGTGDFTWEAWIKPEHWNSNYHTVYCVGSGANTGGLWIGKVLGNFVVRAYSVADQLQTTEFPSVEQWTHVAVSRSGTTLKLFYNGTEIKSVTNSYDFAAGDDIWIGNDAYDNRFIGKVSNLRLVKGTAVYTSSFRPPTAPLTNVTNTKLLCCNDTSVTGSTVTPGTITANGDPTSSTDTPFDDPAGFVFGASEDQNIIKHDFMKCDSSGSATVHLGWEPQWLMWKKTDATGGWGMYDAMRGVTAYSNKDLYMIANGTNAEASSSNDILTFTPTGFKANLSAHGNGEFVFTCIRRPDGYVAKPASAGTDVFAMDTGNASTTIPVFDSGFPVDFAMNRAPASSTSWYTSARIMQDQYLLTNDSAAQNQDDGSYFDSNAGWAKDAYNTWNSDYQSWMWKRGHGMDVVSYEGDSVAGRAIPHSLNSVPEMMWVKRRGTSGDNWWVYHKGMNNGNSPEDYYIALNDPYTGTNTSYAWNDTAPTATHFTLGNNTAVNYSGNTYINFLFSSVTGISKVGYHQCDAGNTTLTMGFQPRFLILKNISTSSTPWVVIDSLRGINPGVGVNTPTINLNGNSAQSNYTWVNSISSTGLVITAGQGERFSNDGDVFIWYAHA